MSELKGASVSRRLDRLERDNRRWKVLAVAALAGLCLVVLTGAGGGKVAGEIRARSFALVDAGGKNRAVLAMGDDGAPTLAAYDADGKRRLALGLTLKNYKGTPGLWLADGEGEVIWRGPR